MTGIGGVEQTGAEEEAVHKMEAPSEVPALVPNDVDGEGKDGQLKESVSSSGARPVTSGICLVCGMDLVSEFPGFRTCSVTMDASKLTLEERLAKIFGLPSTTFEALKGQDTVTCARCLALIFRVDFLEVELPKTKAHVRYLFSKNKTKVFDLPPQQTSAVVNHQQQNHIGSSSSSSSQHMFSRSGSSSTQQSQQKSHQTMPPLYPSGLMNALSQPLATTSTGSSSSMFAGLSNSALAAASSAALLFNSTVPASKRPPSASIPTNASSSGESSPPPPGSPSRSKMNDLRTKVEEEDDDDEAMQLDDEDGDGRKRKRPVPPMRPILDKKHSENGLEKALKQEDLGNDDDEADEMPRKLSRQELEHRLRGNGTTSPAPSNLSSVAEGDMDFNTSDDGDRHAAAMAAAARRYQASDLSALMGSHPDFSTFEGAIAERLKASTSGGLTAEEVLASAGALGAGGKLGNALDSSSANILNSLSSLSSLVGADPARLGLGNIGMQGFSSRSNPLMPRPVGVGSGTSGGGLLSDGYHHPPSMAPGDHQSALLGMPNPAALANPFRQGMRMSKTTDDYPASLSGFSSDSHAKCWLCHLDCRTYKKVEEHFKKEHPGETPFVCEKCGGEFRDLSSYRNHVYYENRKEKLAKGQIKPKSGSSSSSMNSTPGSSAGRRPGRLPDFPASLLTGAVDPTPSSSSSSSSMRCELCKLPFGTESALKEHYLKEHGGMGASPEDFNASLEQYALYSQALLNAHKEYVLSQQKEAVQLQRQLQQQMSGASTSGTNSASSAAGKSSSSAGGSSFVCDECNGSFKSREALSVHKFQDHGAKDSLMKLFSGA